MDHESISEMICREVRESIVTRELRSGDKLREIEICKQYNVSRTPVREAFRILQSEGFVDYNPRTGVTVTILGPEDAIDLYEVRGSLEEISAFKAASLANDSDIRELKKINQNMLECTNNKPEDAIVYDIEFHAKIASITRNSILIKQLAQLHQKTRMVLSFVPFEGNRIPNSCREHQDIIMAIEHGEAQVARQYMGIHFTRSTASLKEKIIRYNEIFNIVKT